MRPPSTDGSTDGSTDAIRERISAMIEARRLRRWRVQRPLLTLSFALVLLGLLAVALGLTYPRAMPWNFRWGYVLMFLAGWVLALTAMSGDVAFMRATICLHVLIAAGACVRLMPIAANAASALHAALSSAEPIGHRRLASLVADTLMLTTNAAVVMLLAGVVPAAILLASCRGMLSPVRLMHVAFKELCIFDGVVSPTYVLFVLAELLRERPDREVAAAFGTLALMTAALSAVGLRDARLRSRVHGFLAMRGHGVSAAAGIAEMLDGVKASCVLRHAASTFRAVSLHEFTREHLREPAPTPAPDARHVRGVTRGPRTPITDRRAPSARASVEPLDARARARSTLDSDMDDGGGALRDAVDVAPPISRRMHDAHAPVEAPPAREVSRPVKLGRVDAFISHSWFARGPAPACAPVRPRDSAAACASPVATCAACCRVRVTRGHVRGVLPRGTGTTRPRPSGRRCSRGALSSVRCTAVSRSSGARSTWRFATSARVRPRGAT